MRRMSGLQSLACCVVLLCSAGAPAAQAKASSDFTALYKLVPARADGFVAVDHVRLAKHKSASKLRNFVHDQGGARGLQAVVRLGLVPGKEILRSVSFNIGRSEADVVRGDFDIEALKVRAKDRLTKAFKEGSEQGHPWFTVTKGRRFVSLSEGTAVIGSPKMVTRVLARAAGKGKPLTSRKAFKALIAPAGKAKASLWGAGWVSKSVRDAMTGRHADLGKGISRTRFHAAGDADVEVRAATFTDSKATATALKALVESEVDRRFNSLTMKMLGVSALVKSASFTTKGKVLLMQMSLTPAQVDLVATTGGKVISILRAKRSK
ncbi:MAG: hypothetical protein ACPGU1_00825 [Myxococcota bacterium]